MKGIIFTQKDARGFIFFSLELPEDFPPSLFISSTKSFDSLTSLCNLSNINPEDIVSAEQVHGARIKVVRSKDRGKNLPQCDAFVTEEINIPLLVRTADCVPIFILDKVMPAIGLIHAGRRGSLGEILPKTMETMREAFDTEAKNCIIAMGPSIGPCCYELDLIQLNELQAIEAGVKKENIVSAGLCTSCNETLFHSWRRDGEETGRLYSIAMLKER